MNYEVKLPILGLNEIKSVELEKHDGITSLLKSDQKNINISLINAFIDENSFVIPTGVKTVLDINEDTNYSVYFTVIVEKDIHDSSINLGAPMIFNDDNKTMAQCVISEDFTRIKDL